MNYSTNSKLWVNVGEGCFVQTPKAGSMPVYVPRYPEYPSTWVIMM